MRKVLMISPLLLLGSFWLQADVILECGFEPEDNFKKSDHSLYQLDETINSPTTDQMGNIWTHSGEGQNWNRDFMGHGNQLQIMNPKIDSFWQVEVAPKNMPRQTLPGIFQYDVRGGTILHNDWVLEGYQILSRQWIELDRVTGFTNNETVTTMKTLVPDTSAFNKYRIRFIGGADLDRIHFDQVKLKAGALSTSFEPHQFEGLMPQAPASADYKIVDNNGLLWVFSSGSYIKDTSEWELNYDGKWSWAAMKNQFLMVKLPGSLPGLINLSFYAKKYNENAPTELLIEKSTNKVTWEKVELITGVTDEFNQYNVTIADSALRYLRIKALDGTTGLTAIDQMSINGNLTATSPSTVTNTDLNSPIDLSRLSIGIKGKTLHWEVSHVDKVKSYRIEYLSNGNWFTLKTLNTPSTTHQLSLPGNEDPVRLLIEPLNGHAQHFLIDKSRNAQYTYEFMMR